MATAAPPDRGRLPERPELAGRCVMWLTADADCAAEADALAHTHGLTRAAVAPADGWHLHLDAQAPELSGPRGLGLPSLRLDLVAAAGHDANAAPTPYCEEEVTVHTMQVCGKFTSYGLKYSRPLTKLCATNSLTTIKAAIEKVCA